MKKMKKIAALFVSVLMAAVSLGGCSGPKTESQAAASSKAAEEESIDLQFWTISLQPKFTDFFNGLIKDYEGTHKNIKITWTDLPIATIQQKLITSSAGGTSPDVVNLNTPMALAMGGKKALVDLNSSASREQTGIYIPSLYDAAKSGDAVYAFPWYASPRIMAYNKALFQKAGITEVPKSFDDMFRQAKTMKDKTGAYLYVPSDLTSLFFMDGIEMLNTDKTKATFNNPQAKALFKKWKDAVDSDVVGKTSWGDYAGRLQLFESGKIAMLDGPGSMVSRIQDEAPDVYSSMGIETPISGTTGLVYDGLMNVAVPSASKHVKEAIDFAAYVTNDDNQLAFCKVVAVFPSTTKASQDAYFTSDTSTLEGLARSMSAQVLPKSSDFSFGTEKQADITAAINKIYEASIEGSVDPDQSFGDAESAVNEILSK